MLKLKWLVACFLIPFSALAWSQQTQPPAEKPTPSLKPQGQSQGKPSAKPGDDGDAQDEDNVRGAVCSMITVRFDVWTLAFVASMYSTYRVEPNCDEKYFYKLTLASINAQSQVVTDSSLTLRGGSHRYTMDVNLTPVPNPFFFVGELRFAKTGEVRIGVIDAIRKGARNIGNLVNNTYTPFEVHSKIHYIWNIGTLSHSLIAPNGDRYILYAYTNEVAPDITRNNLIDLGTRLNLPQGWSYESSLLTRTITVRPTANSGFNSFLLFDEFSNYYVRYIQ